jgi:DNA (cytosine-5)-methyltransferase 1
MEEYIIDKTLFFINKKQKDLFDKNKEETRNIKVLSLFSGCGGMDLGFEGGFEVLAKSVNRHIHPEWYVPTTKKKSKWIKLPETPFKIVFANDIFPAAKASWIPYFSKRKHFSDVFYLESIVDLVKKHKAGEPLFPLADVVIGGFPCQDFSIAGKRNGFTSHKGHHGALLKEKDNPSEENRGKLYLWMRHVIDIIRPKVFVAENVKGLVSLPDAKKIIENDFREIGSGYLVVDAKVLYAPKYGIPQSRERVIFIGFRKDALNPTALNELSSSTISDLYNPYPKETHTSYELPLFHQKLLLPYLTIGESLIDLGEPEGSNDLSHQSYSKAKWYGSHCQGQIEVDLESIAPTIRSEHHGNIEFRRLSAEHQGKYLAELEKGWSERRLSVRECARIQTFPDDFEFVRPPSLLGKEFKLSPSEGYKLVGNAVPPLLAFHIAWRLQELWPLIF